MTSGAATSRRPRASRKIPLPAALTARSRRTGPPDWERPSGPKQKPGCSWTERITVLLARPVRCAPECEGLRNAAGDGELDIALRIRVGEARDAVRAHAVRE